MWEFAVLALLGALIAWASLSSNTPGGVGTGGLGAILIGFPLMAIGVIGFLLKWL